MTVWIELRDESAVGEARRRAVAEAGAAGLAREAQDRAALVATEAATNVLKHGGGGRMLVAPHGPGIVLVASDEGPGITHLDRAMEDGASSAGSMGTGLGAMRRLADSFDIVTSAAEGTVVVTEIRTRSRRGETAPRSAAGGVAAAALKANYPGASVCGDAFVIRPDRNGLALLVCDGLGHGPAAHEASSALGEAFLRSDPADPAEALTDISRAAEGTRGGVGFACIFPEGEETLRFAGVGNTTALLLSRHRTKRLPSRDGRLGGALPRLRQEEVPFPSGTTLILHTDGLRTLRALDAYKSLLHRPPLTMAAVLLCREWRGNDDACVLVARHMPAAGAGERSTP